MYSELIDVDTDGNVFIKDNSIVLMPKLFAVYKNKHMGSNMVKYIVGVYDYKSPFRRLPLDERRSRVAYSIYSKDRPTKVSDKLVEDAIEEYVKLQYDPLIDEYNAMCDQSYKMTKVYRNIEPKADNLEDLNKMQEQMGKAAISRDKIKELILKDQQSESNIKGTGSEDFSVFEQDEIIGKV
jgi:hypothetical protein|tara:strand:+ start:1019 stop:1564 length:546 start_codon:yes stop_codon:yes gene_type:complete